MPRLRVEAGGNGEIRWAHQIDGERLEIEPHLAVDHQLSSGSDRFLSGRPWTDFRRRHHSAGISTADFFLRLGDRAVSVPRSLSDWRNFRQSGLSRALMAAALAWRAAVIFGSERALSAGSLAASWRGSVPAAGRPGGFLGPRHRLRIGRPGRRLDRLEFAAGLGGLGDDLVERLAQIGKFAGQRRRGERLRFRLFLRRGLCRLSCPPPAPRPAARPSISARACRTSAPSARSASSPPAC